VRVDVREKTRQAAKQEMVLNDTCLVLVSREMAERMLTEWSGPVHVKAQPTGWPGIVDLVARKVDA
jgi:hypothetical protein